MILYKNSINQYTKGIRIDTFCAILAVLFLTVGLSSCEDISKSQNDFDRTELLRNAADDIILPAYENWDASVKSLSSAIANFLSDPNQEKLNLARSSFESSYILWQNVAPYEFGPAETIMLKEISNIYPTNTAIIEQLISNGNVNVPNLNDAKGYPAIDYLLYAGSDIEILDAYTTDEHSDNRKMYTQNLIKNIEDNANLVLNEWKNNYANVFKENKGNSDASSISFLLNEFVWHYETHFRKAKLGIPIGIIGVQTIDPNPQKVEGYYAELSLDLFKANFTTLKNIYLGIGDNQVNGVGLDDYLRAVGREDIADDIVNQFQSIETCIAPWNESIEVLINDQFTNVETCYFEIQKLLPLIKAEMPSALSVAITYIEEGDGD